MTMKLSTTPPGKENVEGRVDRASDDLIKLVKAGVSGFVEKDTSVNDLLSIIRSVALGKKVHPSPLDALLGSQVRSLVGLNRGKHSSVAPAITKREWEIIQLRVEGMSTKDIGERLHIAPSTVRAHLRSIRAKLLLSARVNQVRTDDR